MKPNQKLLASAVRVMQESVTNLHVSVRTWSDLLLIDPCAAESRMNQNMVNAVRAQYLDGVVERLHVGTPLSEILVWLNAEKEDAVFLRRQQTVTAISMVIDQVNWIKMLQRTMK